MAMKDADLRFAKFLVLVNAAVPATLLAWDAAHHRLGANPVNFAILTTGMLALIFLMLTMLVTPLRKLSGWNWIIFSRRTLGLYAFFYASLHFLIFFSLDRSFSVSGTLSEMVKRKYLMVGATGLLVMVPLAVTSTNGMIKRLGGKRWRALHRLAYVAAAAGVIHYYMQVKADVRQPLVFAAVLAVLLGYRLVVYLRRPPSTPPAPAPASSKFQRSTNQQPPIRSQNGGTLAGQPLGCLKFGSWRLKFGASLVLGCWNLELIYASTGVLDPVLHALQRRFGRLARADVAVSSENSSSRVVSPGLIFALS